MRKASLLSILALVSALPGTARAASADFDPNIFVELSKKVVPSVVNIQTSILAKVHRPYGRGGSPGRSWPSPTRRPP